jgi:hypothetical protein
VGCDEQCYWTRFSSEARATGGFRQDGLVKVDSCNWEIDHDLISEIPHEWLAAKRDYATV